jgi:hypothetical protein
LAGKGCGRKHKEQEAGKDVRVVTGGCNQGVTSRILPLILELLTKN